MDLKLSGLKAVVTGGQLCGRSKLVCGRRLGRPCADLSRTRTGAIANQDPPMNALGLDCPHDNALRT